MLLFWLLLAFLVGVIFALAVLIWYGSTVSDDLKKRQEERLNREICADLTVSRSPRDMGYRYPDGKLEVTITCPGIPDYVGRISTVEEVPVHYRPLATREFERWFRDNGIMLGLTNDELDECFPLGEGTAIDRLNRKRNLKIGGVN